MATSSPTDCWHINGSEIDWREWGQEFVVRIASRAETHLLSAAAGAVLLALLDSRQTLTLEALYAKAFQDVDPSQAIDQAMSPSERDSLRAIVSDFERLGIVTRVS
jgi:hypothetical protein